MPRQQGVLSSKYCSTSVLYAVESKPLNRRLEENKRNGKG
jgi:hypothetical protein